MTPSCVPSTTPSLGLETPGACIGAEEIRELLPMRGITGLAEVMNYGGVLAKEEEIWNKIEIAKALQAPIDGHAPLLSGNELNAYVLSGVGSDHECVSYTEAREKLRLGMRVREGSAAKNVNKIAPLLPSTDTRNCMLVTDGDRTPLDFTRYRPHERESKNWRCRTASLLRHIGLGFVKGFGVKDGAVAQAAIRRIIHGSRNYSFLLLSIH